MTETCPHNGFKDVSVFRSGREVSGGAIKVKGPARARNPLVEYIALYEGHRERLPCRSKDLMSCIPKIYRTEQSLMSPLITALRANLRMPTIPQVRSDDIFDGITILDHFPAIMADSRRAIGVRPVFLVKFVSSVSGMTHSNIQDRER